MSRPLIAVPARFSESASALRHRAIVGSRNLISLIYAAGGEPLLVHPHAPGGVVSDEEVAERISWAQGILLPGGGDIAAHWSGQDAHHSLYDVDEEQDAFDLAIARIALAKGIPLFAVCRGLQIVNVARGGTLVQDMDEHDSELAHHRHHVHQVTIDHGNGLVDAAGERVEVSCYHHQCLDRLGEGMRVIARSEEGVVEAVDIPGAPGYFVGLQWHPEDNWESVGVQLAVLKQFVDACR